MYPVTLTPNLSAVSHLNHLLWFRSCFSREDQQNVVHTHTHLFSFTHLSFPHHRFIYLKLIIVVSVQTAGMEWTDQSDVIRNALKTNMKVFMEMLATVMCLYCVLLYTHHLLYNKPQYKKTTQHILYLIYSKCVCLVSLVAQRLNLGPLSSASSTVTSLSRHTHRTTADPITSCRSQAPPLHGQALLLFCMFRSFFWCFTSHELLEEITFMYIIYDICMIDGI